MEQTPPVRAVYGIRVNDRFAPGRSGYMFVAPKNLNVYAIGTADPDSILNQMTDNEIIGLYNEYNRLPDNAGYKKLMNEPGPEDYFAKKRYTRLIKLIERGAAIAKARANAAAKAEANASQGGKRRTKRNKRSTKRSKRMRKSLKK